MTDPADHKREPGIRIHEVEDRAAVRHFADLETTLLCSAGRRYDVVMEEISEDGCRLRALAANPPEKGDIVICMVPSIGHRPAKVAWKLDDAFGMAFLVPLHSANVIDLVRLSLVKRLDGFLPRSDPLTNLPGPYHWIK